MSEYAVKVVRLDSIKLQAKILIIPEDKVEEELTIFAGERGLINKTAYEDFLLAAFVVNLSQLLMEIQKHPSLFDIALDFRLELLGHVYTHNSALLPENIYIDESGKLIAAPSEDCVKLEDNDVWKQNSFDSMHPADVPMESDSQFSNPFNHMEYDTVSEWWERLRMYVVIRKYSHDDCLEILNSRYFGDKPAFETFTVIACIEDFEKLFEIIDNFGVNRRIPAARLMSELYDLCRKVNPMLTYDNAQRTEDSDFLSDVISDIEDADMSYPPRDQRNRRMQSAASRRGSQKKEKKPSFKDVPRKELLTLNDRIKRFIIGQAAAVEIIVEAIQRASVGLREPHQPIGCFLMTGPTGIGKTETTKILAQELIKSRTGLIKIDCSEYSSDHEYAKLIGAPAGYIGHDEGGVLTNAIRKNPFSIVVFDEIEKASAKVYDLMLQIMDEGLLTDGKGVPSSFKDAVILMTSNIGVKEIAKVGKKIGFGDVAVLTDDKRIKALEVALKNKFRPEFLNRIDEVVHFVPLDKDSYLKIVDLELKKILDRLKKSEKITVTYDKKVKNFIYKHGVDEKFGARPLKRCIKKKFANKLTRYILNDEINKGDFVAATIKKRAIDFSISKKAEGFDDPPFYLSKNTTTEE